MDRADRIKDFYIEHIPGAKLEGNLLKAPCPFCLSRGKKKPGLIVADLDPESFFLGYFRCLSRCTPGGFPMYFGKIMEIEPQKIPGYDPDREPFVRDIVYPAKNLNGEVKNYLALIDDDIYAHFKEIGISKSVVDEMKIGYNGRYIVYPYFLEDGKCYAARCQLAGRKADSFWHGNEAPFSEEARIFNMQEIERCEGGALFITEGEDNLLTIRQLGYPGIAVSSPADLKNLSEGKLAFINHVFFVMNNTPEAQLLARSLAVRLGFKARILRWPLHLKRGYSLCHLARAKKKGFGKAVSSMIKESKTFSPFSSPEKEHHNILESLERERDKQFLGLSSGFDKMDYALNGIRGITIMGGPPKAGKSCFFMQISTKMAKNKTPVIYYDFENGRQNIYKRTLCRLSRLSEKEIGMKNLEEGSSNRLDIAIRGLKDMLRYFRVVTDRKLTPYIMMRQIEFLKHETRRDNILVVLDSLHKLPFKDLSERRTGIDSWLRNMEAIRDQHNVAFLVVSELSRGEGGHYSEKPDLGSFKESGDIAYSADNAIIFSPDWDPLDPVSIEQRKATLWMVASRENNPGKIATYILEYPFWRFREV